MPNLNEKLTHDDRKHIHSIAAVHFHFVMPLLRSRSADLTAAASRSRSDCWQKCDHDKARLNKSSTFAFPNLSAEILIGEKTSAHRPKPMCHQTCHQEQSCDTKIGRLHDTLHEQRPPNCR